MASSPQYTGTPKNSTVQVSTANTGRDGTGTLADVYTAGASGGRIDELTIHATGTTTAGMIRLFLSDTTNHRLIQEIPVIAITPSSTVPAWSGKVSFDGGLILQGTYVLKASTHNAETFNVVVTQGGDF